MFVKFLTISSCLLLLAGCGREVEVHTYTEVNQLPPPKPAAPDRNLPDNLRAGPLNVAPVPENLPPNHPTLAGGASSALPGAAMRGREGEVPPPPAASDVTWDVPEGWTGTASTGMRLAEFRPQGAGDQAIVTLIALGSQPLEPNVARWRRQVGLPEEHVHDHVTVQGKLPYVLVNLVAESAAADLPSSTIGAIYNLPGRTLFLKFTGDTQLLIQHKGGFLTLANSIALNEDAP
jgi:hypothetical protein